MKRISISLFIIFLLVFFSGGAYGKTISQKKIALNELSITAGGLSDSTGETLHFYKDDKILHMTVFTGNTGEIKCVKITTEDQGFFYIFDVKKLIFNHGNRYSVDNSLVNQRQRQEFQLLVIQKTIDELVIP